MKSRSAGSSVRDALVEISAASARCLHGAAAQGRSRRWLHRDLSPGGAAVPRQADCPAGKLRGAGGDRDGERAADDRAARGAGAADRDRRGAAGDQRVAWQSAPVFAAVLEKAMRLCECRLRLSQLLRRRMFPCGRDAGRRSCSGGVSSGTHPVGASRLALHRIAQGENVVHIADITDDRRLPVRRCRAQSGCRPGRRAQSAHGVRSARTETCWARSTSSVSRSGLLGPADRARAELRRAGGDSDGERAAADGATRSLGAADRDLRCVAGHQFVAR